jgi:hypothetical protein
MSAECALRDKLKRKVLGPNSSSRLQQHAFNSLLDTLGIQTSEPSPQKDESLDATHHKLLEQHGSDAESSDAGSPCQLRLSDLKLQALLSFVNFEIKCLWMSHLSQGRVGRSDSTPDTVIHSSLEYQPFDLLMVRNPARPLKAPR